MLNKRNATLALAVCWVAIGYGFSLPLVARPELVAMPNWARALMWAVPAVLAVVTSGLPCGGAVALSLMAVGPSERFASLTAVLIAGRWPDSWFAATFYLVALIAVMSVSRLPSSRECLRRRGKGESA